MYCFERNSNWKTSLSKWTVERMRLRKSQQRQAYSLGCKSSHECTCSLITLLLDLLDTRRFIKVCGSLTASNVIFALSIAHRFYRWKHGTRIGASNCDREHFGALHGCRWLATITPATRPVWIQEQNQTMARLWKHWNLARFHKWKTYY